MMILMIYGNKIILLFIDVVCLIHFLQLMMILWRMWIKLTIRQNGNIAFVLERC